MFLFGNTVGPWMNTFLSHAHDERIIIISIYYFIILQL